MELQEIKEKYGNIELRVFGVHSKGIDYYGFVDEILIIFTYTSETFDSLKFPHNINSNQFVHSDKYHFKIDNEVNIENRIVIYIEDKKEV